MAEIFERTIPDVVVTNDELLSVYDSVRSADDSALALETIEVQFLSSDEIVIDLFEEIEAEDTIVQDFIKSVTDSVTVTDQAVPLLTGTLDIALVRALSSTKIRIDFNRPVKINDALTDVASYNLSPVTAGAVNVFPLSVELPVGQSFPLFITINTTEHTDVATYSAQLVGALEGSNDEPIGSGVFEYTGIGDIPKVALVLSTGQTSVEVQFTESMLNNASIFDLDLYSFDNGLQIVSIDSVVGDVVTMTTSAQAPGILYTLTILGSDQISDSVTVDDQVTIEFFLVHQIVKSESIQIDDEVLISFETGAAQTDSVSVTDQVEILTDPLQGFDVDSVAVADQVVRETVSVRDVSDTIATTDEVTLLPENAVVSGSDEDVVVSGSTEVIVVSGSA